MFGHVSMHFKWGNWYHHWNLIFMNLSKFQNSLLLFHFSSKITQKQGCWRVLLLQMIWQRLIWWQRLHKLWLFEVFITVLFHLFLYFHSEGFTFVRMVSWRLSLRKITQNHMYWSSSVVDIPEKNLEDVPSFTGKDVMRDVSSIFGMPSIIVNSSSNELKWNICASLHEILQNVY